MLFQDRKLEISGHFLQIEVAFLHSFSLAYIPENQEIHTSIRSILLLTGLNSALNGILIYRVIFIKDQLLEVCEHVNPEEYFYDG